MREQPAPKAAKHSNLDYAINLSFSLQEANIYTVTTTPATAAAVAAAKSTSVCFFPKLNRAEQDRIAHHEYCLHSTCHAQQLVTFFQCITFCKMYKYMKLAISSPCSVTIANGTYTSVYKRKKRETERAHGKYPLGSFVIYCLSSTSLKKTETNIQLD